MMSDITINWSAVKRGEDFGANCEDGFMSIETIEEVGHNIGYYINVRHGSGFDGHYICVIRDGKIIGEADCPTGLDEGPIDRPADVVQILLKLYNELPEEYSRIIKTVYKF